MFSVKVAKKLQISTQFTKREKFPLLYLALEHKFLRVVRQSADKAHTYSRKAERRLCCRLWSGRGCGSACLRVCESESERERKRETVSFSQHFFPGWSASVVSLCSPQCCLSHFYTQLIGLNRSQSQTKTRWESTLSVRLHIVALNFCPVLWLPWIFIHVSQALPPSSSSSSSSPSLQ